MSVKIIYNFFRDDDSGYIFANPDGTFSLLYKTLCGPSYEFVLTVGYLDLEDAIDDFDDLYHRVSRWQEYIGTSRREIY